MVKNRVRNGAVYIVSLGCPKNLVDTELMSGNLVADGWGITFSPGEADVFLINTCAFIPPARDEARDAIEEAIYWKNECDQDRKIIVAGCLVQWDSEALFRREYPEVDMWVGIDQVASLAENLKLVYADTPPEAKPFLRRDNPAFIYNDQLPRLQLTLPHLAYLKITEGCDNCCSYCLIPSIRGRLRSRTIESVVAEAAGLIRNGARELLLIGQDITAFGMEAGGKGTLAELLRELDQFDGKYWVRLLYTHPAHFSDELIEAVAGAKNILPYLDVPLQHISDHILQAMGRKISRSGIVALVERLRKSIPNLTLRTTFITGFPGESELDFNELKSFVREQEFQRFGVFSFFPEPGTPASRLPDPVPHAVGEQRATELMNIQAEISLRNNRLLIGEKVEAIFDVCRPDGAIGRSIMDAPEIDNTIVIKGRTNIRPGDIRQVVVTKADVYDLMAELPNTVRRRKAVGRR